VFNDEGKPSGGGFSLLRLLITKKMARTKSVTSATAPITTPAIAPLDKLFDDFADLLSVVGVADDSVGCAAVVVEDIVATEGIGVCMASVVSPAALLILNVQCEPCSAVFITGMMEPSELLLTPKNWNCPMAMFVSFLVPSGHRVMFHCCDKSPDEGRS